MTADVGTAAPAKPVSPPTKRPQQSAATQLIQLAKERAELFHDTDGNPFATIKIGGRRETWALRTKAFRRWLAGVYYHSTHHAPGGQALQDALNVLEANATFEGPMSPVYTRLGFNNDSVYLDLADDQWRAVEINSAGWRVIDETPIKFRRARGMAALPRPIYGGTLTDLQNFVNVSDDDWVLLISWLLAALRPAGPYPVLVLHGEQGAAKSTTARVLKGLIDPNTAALRSSPRDGRDLMIAATNGWLLAFDNLSWLPSWFSDALCRLSTGGGFATRELYSDQEETLFDAERPVVLNGIGELASRGDLVDRSIILHLPQILDEKRQPEVKFWAKFEAARPYLLGCLLSVVEAAMRKLPTVELTNLPRMADFALWAVAAEPALHWESGTFLAAYLGNRQSANDLALEASPAIGALRKWLADIISDTWEGTCTDLLDKLQGYVSENVRKLKVWPKTARGLSGVLHRAAPNLRAIGIGVEFHRSSDAERQRLVVIRKSLQATVPPSKTDLSGQQPSKNEGQPSEDRAIPSKNGDGAGEDWQNLPGDWTVDGGLRTVDGPFRTVEDGTGRLDGGEHTYSEAESEAVEL